MIAAGCHQLAEFVDGELRDEEAERFREHLASCERCAAEMPRLLELVAACEEIRPAAGVVALVTEDVVRSRRARARRTRIVAVVGFVAAAAAVLTIAVRHDPPIATRTALAGLGPTRRIEGRLSYAGAREHRPYEVQRGQAAAEDIPFALLAALERAGDWHGLGVATLLRGDRASAARYLERAQRSPEVDSDRAALAIADGSEAALRQARVLLDDVLAADPNHAAARWNRAIILTRLGSTKDAIRDFDRLAAAGEPGWSGEARAREGPLAPGRRADRTVTAFSATSRSSGAAQKMCPTPRYNPEVPSGEWA